MHSATRRFLISLLALGLSGCGSGKRINYYTVQMPVAPTRSTGSFPVSLLVGNINGPNIYRDSPIAYRVGTNEIGVYQYSRWVDPPLDMVKVKLLRILEESGDYQSVSGLGSATAGQYIVRGRLYNFDEVDGASINGQVSMEFELYDRKSGKIVWRHFYSQSEPAQGKDIAAVVTALDTNLDRGLKEVAAGLNQYFSANPVGKS
jgi:ABC-type uncharacterized transport system auxiliary subunit